MASILLNGLFLLTTSKLELPFFLDSIFTILVTVLFGFWPGVITGVFSNFFFEVLFGFPGYLYPFFIVNVSSAIITFLHVKYTDFTNAVNAFLLILSLSVVNSILGAVIVVAVFDGITDQPFDSIVRAVVTTGQSLFTSAFLARILMNIVDKGIAVLIAFFTNRVLTKKFPEK